MFGVWVVVKNLCSFRFITYHMLGFCARMSSFANLCCAKFVTLIKSVYCIRVCERAWERVAKWVVN